MQPVTLKSVNSYTKLSRIFLIIFETTPASAQNLETSHKLKFEFALAKASHCIWHCRRRFLRLRLAASKVKWGNFFSRAA